MLLLTSRKLWPVLIFAGLGALAVADLTNGVLVRQEIWITLGNAVDVLIVTCGVHLLFRGAPRLGSVKALAKFFAIAVILAPAVSALLGAIYAAPGAYWLQWRIWCFADALGFLTVTPTILGWAHEGRAWARSFGNYLELAALMGLLVWGSYFAFASAPLLDSPALLYSLVPILLWAALRLGVKGISASIVVVAFLAVWGASKDLGPFTGQGPLNNALSLQLFLFFAAITFMVLAVVVEEEKQNYAERKLAEQALRQSEERLRFATRAGRMFAYEWDLTTDVMLRSPECAEILGLTGSVTNTTGQSASGTVYPGDHEQLLAAMAALRPETPFYRLASRVFRPDGSIVWLEGTGRGFFDSQGKLARTVGMAVDITERKRSEEALRESEARFRNTFRDAGVGMIIVSPDGHFLAANDTFCSYLGYTEEELRHLSVEAITQPEDWAAFSARLHEALSTGVSFRRFEKRCRHKDGHTVYTESSATLVQTPNGEPSYFVGEVLDITERKLAEESLSVANRRLLQEQEREAARIARDLHDDINQRIALLSIEIQQLVPSAAGSTEDLGQRLEELSKTTAGISSDIQSISHRLHPSKLELLGLVPAINGFCREFAQRQKIEIQFSHHNIPAEVPWEVSVCLYRVAQEALHNAVKYSGVQRFEVRLDETADGIRLRIADSGSGFEPEATITQPGLGLVSMRERLRLVRGTLSIATSPGAGTTIEALVPKPGQKSKAAAGAGSCS